MKFLSIHLRPYGPFTDRLWDFSSADDEGGEGSASAGAGGLHLIHGPNGAGKSTLLRAMRSVLFGMPSRTDAHTFLPKDLRIGAHLQRSSGETLQFLRRGARKQPLWNSADEEAVAIEQLSPFLGGLDRGRFESIYGLDLETMQLGGEELLKGEGDIGQALYGAALGGTRLSSILTRLRKESSDLYGDSSTKALLNSQFSELKNITHERKRNERRFNTYDKNRKAWDRYQKDVKRLRSERSDVQHEVQGLERKRSLITPLRQLDRIALDLADLGDEQPLDADSVEQFEKLRDETRDADGDGRRLDEAIRKRTEAVAALELLANDTLLQAREPLHDLHGRVAAYMDALECLPDLEEQRNAARSQAGVEDLNVKAVDDPAEALSILDDLAGRRRASRAAATKAGREQLHAKAELDRLTASASQVEAEFMADTRTEFEALVPFSGTVTELAAAVPPPRSVVTARQTLESARASAELSRAHERKALEARESDARATQRLLAEAPGGIPPSTADLTAAREARDALWGDLRSGLLSGEAPAASSIPDVSGAIQAADAIGDRMRNAGEETLERLRTDRELEEVAQLLESLSADARSDEAQRQIEDAEWVNTWHVASLEPLDAGAMGIWITQREVLLKMLKERRASARARAEEADRRLAERAAELEFETDSLTEAEQRWQAWTERTGFDQDVTEERAETVLRAVVSAGEAAKRFASLKPQCQKLKALVDTFEDDARELSEKTGVARSVDADGESEQALQRERQLGEASGEATRVDVELTQMGRAQQTDEEARQRVTQRSASIASNLSELRSACGTPDAEAFATRVHTSERHASLLKDRESLKADVAEIAGDQSLEDVRASLADALHADTDGLDGPTVLDGLSTEIEARRLRDGELSAQLEEALEQIGHLRREVEGEGSDAAARLESSGASLMANIAEDTERYVQLELARFLLEREIEAHRIEHQGPLLQRAGELFKTLTLGAYVRLVPSEDASGKPVMVARRPNGSSVGAVGMSTGTRDQLYLALRIASVEHMLKTTEPMPFIADDLFVNFDDARTEAALRVLFDLARSTQVIVFSHHEHVIESAHKLSSEGVPIRVHELLSEGDREAARHASAAGTAGAEV